MYTTIYPVRRQREWCLFFYPLVLLFITVVGKREKKPYRACGGNRTGGARLLLCNRTPRARALSQFFPVVDNRTADISAGRFENSPGYIYKNIVLSRVQTLGRARASVSAFSRPKIAIILYDSVFRYYYRNGVVQ